MDEVLDDKGEIKPADVAPQEPAGEEVGIVPLFVGDEMPEPFCVVPIVPVSELPADSQGEVPAEEIDNFSVDAGDSEPIVPQRNQNGTVKKNVGVVHRQVGGGRPTELTEEAFRNIRDCVLAGGGLAEIADAIRVAPATVYDWSSRNYKDFSDKVHSYEVERLVKQAESNAQDFLRMHPESASDKVVKANMTTFVLETAGKKTYSKRTELTGSDGKDIGVVVLPSKDKIG